MEYAQSLAIWMAVKSIMESIRERRAPAEARTSKQEEGFVPFHLPPVKPKPTEEAKPAVAVPVGV